MSNIIYHPTTTFVGRDEALNAVIAMLHQPECCMVTLIGPGGIGKTRLAMEVAEHFRATHTVYLLSLQNIETAEQFATALANTVNVTLRDSENVLKQFLCYLPKTPTLIVLDNFESLLEAADVLAAIIAQVPEIQFLVTSRVVLHLQDEWVYEVGGLNVTDSVDSSAVQLFAQRAARMRQNFDAEAELAAIVRICQLLQGNPLALELAATWVRALTCQQIVDELQRGLDILNTNLRDVEQRHRSMAAVFEQSWKLLSADEQETFKRLSIFCSHFSQEAACKIAGVSLLQLANLVDHSLLRLVNNGRYEIHELVRAYALQRLDDATEHTVRKQHAHYFSEFAYQQILSLKNAAQAEALNCIEAEFDQIIAAWEWAVQHQDTWVLEKMLLPLSLYAPTRSRYIEVYQALLLAETKLPVETSLLNAQLAMTQGWFAFWVGKIDAARNNIQRGMALLDLLQIKGQLPMALSILSWYENDARVDFGELYQRYERELQYYQAQGDDWGAAWMLYGMGNISRSFGNHDTSKSQLEMSVQLFNGIGDGWGKTWALGGLCTTLRYMNQFAAAIVLYEELLTIGKAVADDGAVIYALHGLGYSHQALNQIAAAQDYYLQALRLSLKTHNAWNMLDAALRVGEVLSAERINPVSVELFAAVQQHPLTGTGWLHQRRERAVTGLQDLQDKLPPEAYQAAVQRGSQGDLRRVIEELLDRLAAPQLSSNGNGAHQQALIEPLSERELEVLQLLVIGRSNRQIAAELILALGTVKTHIHNIYGKLNVSNRTEAAAQARSLGLLEL
jgi:predicted ATPase/DNA-binding CsgD family transcriptional regulator